MAGYVTESGWQIYIYDPARHKLCRTSVRDSLGYSVLSKMMDQFIWLWEMMGKSFQACIGLEMTTEFEKHDNAHQMIQFMRATESMNGLSLGAWQIYAMSANEHLSFWIESRDDLRMLKGN